MAKYDPCRQQNAENGYEKAEVCLFGLTVKAAMFGAMLQQSAMSLHWRTKNKHPRVEAVGPAGVRSSWQFCSVEQFIYIWEYLGFTKTNMLQWLLLEQDINTRIDNMTSHQRVCVHENTLGVVCERPAVEFGEGDAQVRSLHHCQMCRVPAVQDVHHPNLIKNPFQNIPSIKQCKNKKQSPSTVKIRGKIWAFHQAQVSYWQGSDTCGPMRATSFLAVPWFRRDLPRTIAPRA